MGDCVNGGLGKDSRNLRKESTGRNLRKESTGRNLRKESTGRNLQEGIYKKAFWVGVYTRRRKEGEHLQAGWEHLTDLI